MTTSVQTLYRQAADAYARRLVEEIPEVQAVVLYGSVARDEADEDSDIDMLVLVDRSTKALERRIVELAWQTDERGVMLQVIVEDVPYFRSWLEQGSPLERTIARMGVALFDRGAFAGIRKLVPSLREEGTPYQPSRELFDNYMQKADEALAEAKVLSEGNFWDGVSNRAYYAMFSAERSGPHSRRGGDTEP
jgi:predicted nucleotidyltransferase